MSDLMEIDGSRWSGSGTIVRHAVAMASLLARPIRIRNIRARRGNPGLRPQHLKAVQACCALTGGSLENARVGSSEILYRPGRGIRGGDFRWDIGTAGSTTMMALCLLPVSLFASGPSRHVITGGLFQDFAPNAFHLQHVLCPLLARFGIRAAVRVEKPGYVPSGGGVLELTVERGIRLKPLRLIDPGAVTKGRGIALASHLREGRVAERMREAFLKAVAGKGWDPDIRIVEDTSAEQQGAAFAVWAVTQGGCLIGADRAGKRGRSSEEIGRHVARCLLEDLGSGAAVDRFAADQLILFAALAMLLGAGLYFSVRLRFEGAEDQV